jgi:hypothetical protein
MAEVTSSNCAPPLRGTPAASNWTALSSHPNARVPNVLDLGVDAGMNSTPSSCLSASMCFLILAVMRSCSAWASSARLRQSAASAAILPLMASRRRARQARIDASIAATPDFARTICYTRSYIEEGVQLLELAHRAHVLFESQPATEKRKLLDFVLSNCTWKGGELTAKYRQPFDVLAVAVASEQQRVVGEMAETAKNEIWLPR